MTKRVGLYLRVSTKNGQTVDNQRQALTEAIGHRQGWIIAEEFADAGISGAKGRDKRPEFDRLLREVVRGKIDVVAAWSVDRLGRSLQDLVGFLGELNAAGRTSTSKSKLSTQPHPPDGHSFRCSAYLQSSSAPLFRNGYMPGLPGRETRAPRAVSRSVGRGSTRGGRLQSAQGILKTARQVGTGTSVVQRIKAELVRDDNTDA
jgi:Resolvase, N terminal domain